MYPVSLHMLRKLLVCAFAYQKFYSLTASVKYFVQFNQYLLEQRTRKQINSKSSFYLK